MEAKLKRKVIQERSSLQKVQKTLILNVVFQFYATCEEKKEDHFSKFQSFFFFYPFSIFPLGTPTPFASGIRPGGLERSPFGRLVGAGSARVGVGAGPDRGREAAPVEPTVS